MLPDAGYRLKWTYGVEAFQQWCMQRNRPILSAPAEGFSYISSSSYSIKIFF